jgi:hypothetical protein
LPHASAAAGPPVAALASAAAAVSAVVAVAAAAVASAAAGMVSGLPSDESGHDDIHPEVREDLLRRELGASSR